MTSTVKGTMNDRNHGAWNTRPASTEAASNDASGRRTGSSSSSALEAPTTTGQPSP